MIEELDNKEIKNCTVWIVQQKHWATEEMNGSYLHYSYESLDEEDQAFKNMQGNNNNFGQVLAKAVSCKGVKVYLLLYPNTILYPNTRPYNHAKSYVEKVWEEVSSMDLTEMPLLKARSKSALERAFAARIMRYGYGDS